MRPFGRRLAVLIPAGCAGLVLGALMLTGMALAATTITVNSLADTAPSPASKYCVLRDAITAANSGLSVHGCKATSSSPYTIVFKSGLTGTTTLSSTLPAITSNITIQGPGPLSPIAISGQNRYEVLVVSSLGSLRLNSLTVVNGFGDDGAIDNLGTLTVNNSTFSSNEGELGGAIDLAAGTANIANSTFTGNTATFEGGGILGGAR